MYLEHTFYLTLFFDWRGRIYTETSYLTYQGNSLAKAMMSFKNGGLISEPEHFEVLLAYGASLYGLSKLSFDERVNWSITNFDKIVSMDENFILSAEEPFLFISWSLEIKSNKDNIILKTPYISHLPIQWDATCNGLQHLSLLCNDVELAKSVNIVSSNKIDKPLDVYSIILDYIKNEINQLAKKEPDIYGNLSKFPLSRKLIKKSIMTIPYSVTLIGVKEQLIENLTKVKIPTGGTKFIYVYDYHEDNQSFRLNNKELFILAKFIHNSIFNLHPKLKIFVNYWYQVTNLLTSYNLGLKWLVPNGLLINQKYVHFEKITLFYKLFSKNKQVTLRKPTDKINLRKQKSGILPNLIHSLDACVLTLLTNKIITSGLNIPFYSVHDCFASTANNMFTLKTFYQHSLLDVYEDNKILKTIQKDINDYIKAQKPNSKNDLEIPDLNILIKPRINKNLMKHIRESFNIII